MWNYWIGGTDNFLADREAGDRVLEAMPALPLVARTLRRFLTTTVEDLTAAGVRQFLDIGSGLPTADNTHDVAQRGERRTTSRPTFGTGRGSRPARSGPWTSMSRSPSY
jgi:hypothetical protein